MRFCSLCVGWLILGVSAAASAADNPNLALRAEITASVAADAAAKVADGKVPPAGGRDDRGTVWTVNEADLPAALVFAWPEPVTVSTVVYYGRTTWSFESFKDYALYLDDAAEPIATGVFRNGHGPQSVTLPEPVTARRLRLEFRSRHAGGRCGWAQGRPGTIRPGAAEVQIFARPPTQEALLGQFTDLALDYRYAYYPSHDLVRVHLPKPPADATEWHLALRPAEGGRVLAERAGKLPMAAGGEGMPVPDLAAGDYTLTLTLAGGPQPVIEERPIRRDRPEWEGNRLGREDLVIPPFTPLTADEQANRVGCVLRSHEHGPAGFWRQVVSQGRDLLAGPVRLEVAQGGTVHAAAGPGPRFTSRKPTAVSGEAAWTAGPLSGTTRFVYDYDGLQMITLVLAPTATEVERVQLVIPLQASEAWLMHPVTTQLRMHFAGRIPALPAGSPAGRVWDSARVPNLLNGTFVPSIYLGGPERGICFAADNDRDWITDAGTPMMVIDREGDAVLLRLNLVAKPARLTRERTIRFALQATPAKPMPEEPVNWRRWWATNTDATVADFQINFWGANMYWGGLHFATSVHPAFKGYDFWEQLAESRRTGKRDPGFADRWRSRFENLPEHVVEAGHGLDLVKDVGQLATHYNAGLTWAAGAAVNTPETKKFQALIPYTNPRGASIETPEFISTYIDEWLGGDIVDPRWHAFPTNERPRRVHDGFPGIACWYQVEPVSSLHDMLLFYHQKMLATFADGIYWDNFFLQPSFVPAEAGGPGYVDDEGRPRAGVNLMGFRELVKRTATMMHVMGKRPLTYIHMTNVNIVPMLSFGTINLDWEWRDQGPLGSMDLQDRIGLDEILAHHLGLQAGNVSVGITGNILKGPKEVREWLHRTGMAVCFPHEIRMHHGTPEVAFVQTALTRFGYGLPDCKVFRYWDEGFPLRTEGAEMRGLVLARNGRAMIALGNYGAAGGAAEAQPYTVRLQLDLQQLGLPENSQAHDVELQAGRTKARSPKPVQPPRPSGDATPEPEPDSPAEDRAAPLPVLRRIAPGVFELSIRRHDFALIEVGD
jgi:hypothetical protein